MSNFLSILNLGANKPAQPPALLQTQSVQKQDSVNDDFERCLESAGEKEDAKPQDTSAPKAKEKPETPSSEKSNFESSQAKAQEEQAAQAAQASAENAKVREVEEEKVENLDGELEGDVAVDGELDETKVFDNEMEAAEGEGVDKPGKRWGQVADKEALKAAEQAERKAAVEAKVAELRANGKLKHTDSSEGEEGEETAEKNTEASPEVDGIETQTGEEGEILETKDWAQARKGESENKHESAAANRTRTKTLGTKPEDLTAPRERERQTRSVEVEPEVDNIVHRGRAQHVDETSDNPGAMGRRVAAMASEMARGREVSLDRLRKEREKISSLIPEKGRQVAEKILSELGKGELEALLEKKASEKTEFPLTGTSFAEERVMQNLMESWQKLNELMEEDPQLEVRIMERVENLSQGRLQVVTEKVHVERLPHAELKEIPQIITKVIESSTRALPQRVEIPLRTPAGAEIHLFLQQAGNHVRAQLSTHNRAAMEWIQQEFSNLKNIQFETNVRWTPPQFEQGEQNLREQNPHLNHQNRHNTSRQASDEAQAFEEAFNFQNEVEVEEVSS